MAAANMGLTLVLSTAVLLCVQSAPLDLRGDFDSQLQQILRQEMLSPQETADIISQDLGDVLTTLNERWQGYEVSVCGSLPLGLGTKTSDLDVVVRLPNFNTSSGLYVLQETEKLFKKHPTLYSELKLKYRPHLNCTFFKFVHVPSRLNMQIQFDAGDRCVSNHNHLQYFLNLDPRIHPLAGFVKYWFQFRELTHVGKNTLQNYAVYLLVIFYLQQKDMAPPGYLLQVHYKSHITVGGWDVGFNKLPFRSENTESLHQLLGGFFKYYSKFDFEHNIVSPFAGRPIPRNAFTDIDNFPKEYTLNNNTSIRTQKLKIRNNWNTTADVCVQDVFLHHSNVARRLSHEFATKFKHLLKSVAAMFDELPSESVLGAVLSQNNCTDYSTER